MYAWEFALRGEGRCVDRIILPGGKKKNVKRKGGKGLLNIGVFEEGVKVGRVVRAGMRILVLRG